LTPFGHELFCYDNYPHCNATDVTEIYSAENGTWITGPEYMIKKIENLEIAGNPAVRYTTDINSSVEVVAVKQGEATYQFFLGSLENEINSNRMLFDAILTTFQFMK
jgi:hypothetical protein